MVNYLLLAMLWIPVWVPGQHGEFLISWSYKKEPLNKASKQRLIIKFHSYATTIGFSTNMIRKLLTCFYREPRENQNNSGNQQNVSCFNVRRVRSHKPDLLTRLPPELRLNIAERLPLPSLLSLRTVNSNMYHIIDSKMLSKAKERCVYEFQILQKPLNLENIEQRLLSEWQNVNVIYCDEENRGNSYNIQSIDGVDKLGSFTTGRFTDGSYFIYVSANFEDRGNMRIAITLSQENRNLYLGSSYSQISDYIKNHRTDDLVNHVEWISQHTKKYF